jgi:hypothetical protein
MRGLLLTLATIVALALPDTATAQRVMHRVRFGENLGSISKHYYGTREHADLLRHVNRLASAASLKAGDRLRIPTAWEYTVRRRTNARRLAAKLLGDGRRWRALNLANKLRRRRRIRRGTRLIIPCVLKVTARPGETFADLSQRYYDTRKYAALIASYNFIKGDRPPPSAQLEIPLGHVQIRPVVLDELVRKRLLGVSSEAGEEKRQALREANALLRRGDYWMVPLRLIRNLSRNEAADEHVAEVFKLLAISYVAVDREGLAIEAFKEALLRQPTLALDPITHSPKVIRAFAEAKSQMREGE